MRSKLTTVLLIGVIAFLLATNPTVSRAAGMITGKQIKNGSITGKDIKNHSVRASDLSSSIAGQPGPVGPQGPAGLSGYQIVTSAFISASANAQTQGSVTCPGTTTVLGGGSFSYAALTSFTMNDSYPIGRTWYVDMNNTDNTAHNFKVSAVCAAVAN